MSTQPAIYAFFSFWTLTLACFGGMLPVYHAFYPILSLCFLLYIVYRHGLPATNLALYALFAMGLLIAFQLVPLPSFLLWALAPFKYDQSVAFLKNLSYVDASNKLLFYPITNSLVATRSALYLFWGFAGLWISTLSLSEISRKTQEKAMFIFIYGSLAIATLGVIHLFSGSPKLLWLFSKGYLFFGPFVNRNHAGGLLSVAAICSLAMAFSQSLKSHRFFLLAAYFIFFLSLAFISSRAALLNVIVFSTLTLYAFTQTKKIPFKKIAWFLGFLFLVLIGLSLAWKATIFQRIYQHREFRASFWFYALSLFLKSPWFGTGAGTFAGLSPQYVGNSAWIHPEHVENDYLEILADTGLFGAMLTMTFLYPFLRQSALLLREKSSSTLSKAFSLGFLAFCFHSIFVFHLPLPASHFLFCFFCLGLAPKIQDKKHLNSYVTRILIGVFACATFLLFVFKPSSPKIEAVEIFSSLSQSNMKALKHLHQDAYETTKEAFIKNPDSTALYPLSFLEHQFGNPHTALLLARESIRRDPLALDHRLKLISYFGEHGFPEDAEIWALEHIKGSAPTSEEFKSRLYAELSLHYLKHHLDKSKHYLTLAMQHSKNEWNSTLYDYLQKNEPAKALAESWKLYRSRYTDPLLWDLKWLSLSKNFPEVTSAEAVASLAFMRPDFIKFWKNNAWLKLWPTPPTSADLQIQGNPANYRLEGNRIFVHIDQHQPEPGFITLPIHISAPPIQTSYRLRMILHTRQKLSTGLLVHSGQKRFVSPEPPIQIGGNRWALVYSNFKEMIDAISFIPLDKNGEYTLESIEIFVNSQS